MIDDSRRCPFFSGRLRPPSRNGLIHQLSGRYLSAGAGVVRALSLEQTTEIPDCAKIDAAALASRLRRAPLFPFVLRQIALGFVQIDVHALGDGPPVEARKSALPIQHACDGAVAPDER